SDPENLSREITALVNNNDDNGVIVCSRAYNYKGGTSPSAWTGSSSIYYIRKVEDSVQLIGIDSNVMGLNISTKKVGRNSRKD
ncbi:protein-glutamine gamma-glutamyltransferase K-like, partial [Pempheris klunzingeri]|uniref:protein-glutamine gamma-glutamyltransferase K-like n=1 Tax=Pempheris klunzingeri TaxID=3127111 RepID=UPI003981606E